MAAHRVQNARIAVNFPAGRDDLLLEALDVGRHLPLAVLGDKILDTLIVLAFREQKFTPHQLQDEITRLARNYNLIHAAVVLGLQHTLLIRGEPTQGTVPIASFNGKTYKRKQPPLNDSPYVVYDKKVLADTVEALVGAAFLADGLYAAAKVVKALRLDWLPVNDVRSWQFNWERIEHLYHFQQVQQLHQSQDEDDGYESGVGEFFAGVEMNTQGN